VLLRIDPGSTEPLFAQLADSLRAEVLRGTAKPGDRLPTARELAASLEINLHTVLRAYQELRDEGLIELRRGRGAVVTENAGVSGELIAAVRDLVADARRIGVGVGTLTALIREEYTA